MFLILNGLITNARDFEKELEKFISIVQSNPGLITYLWTQYDKKIMVIGRFKTPAAAITHEKLVNAYFEENGSFKTFKIYQVNLVDASDELKRAAQKISSNVANYKSIAGYFHSAKPPPLPKPLPPPEPPKTTSPCIIM